MVNLISADKTQHKYEYSIHFYANMKSKFMVYAEKGCYRWNKVVKIKESFD